MEISPLYFFFEKKGIILVCSECKLDKEEKEFYFIKKKNKFHPWCRPCSAKYARQRRKEKTQVGGFCTGCYKPSENKLCDVCIGRPVDKENSKRRTAKWRKRNPGYARDYSRSKKKKILEAYGNKCECCKVTNFEFLTLDHINGGGYRHRKEVKNIYAWIIKHNFPKGFRTLCMNCNFALGRYGYCPHQKSALESPLTQISGSQEHLSL